MHIKLKTSQGAIIHAEKNPVKRGGEGAIHQVLANTGPPLVAKIWHDHQKAFRAQDRIRWMIEHSPLKSAPASIQNSIIWPKDLLYRNRKFVGYTMELVPNAIKLFSFIQADFPNQQWGNEWKKFSLPTGLRNRLIVCYNLVQAVDFLHKTGHYQVVDMKPENILIKPNGHISLIDMDSMQISNNGRMLYPATVFTSEYAPQEFHYEKALKCDLNEVTREHDLFSLAVILYQILMNVHPFQASHAVNTALHQNILHGLWVHGPRKSLLHRIPQLHNSYHRLPQTIKDLFYQTFAEGHYTPGKRVHTEQWTNTLLEELYRGNKAPGQRRKQFPAAPPRQTSTKKPAVKRKKAAPQKEKVNTDRGLWIRITNYVFFIK